MKEITFRIGDPCDQGGIQIRCIDQYNKWYSTTLIDFMDLYHSDIPFATILKYKLEEALSYHDKNDPEFQFLHDFILGLERKEVSK